MQGQEVAYSRIQETSVRFTERQRYSVSGIEKDTSVVQNLHEENVERKENNDYVGCGRGIF